MFIFTLCYYLVVERMAQIYRVFSSYYYILQIDLMIREVAANQEENNFTLAYADDIAQTAASEAELEEIRNRWKTVFNKYHLKLNLQKMEIMMTGRVHRNLKQVTSFKYLSSIINDRLLKDKQVSKKAKQIIHKPF